MRLTGVAGRATAIERESRVLFYHTLCKRSQTRHSWSSEEPTILSSSWNPVEDRNNLEKLNLAVFLIFQPPFLMIMILQGNVGPHPLIRLDKTAAESNEIRSLHSFMTWKRSAIYENEALVRSPWFHLTRGEFKVLVPEIPLSTQ
ncbi:unnamed protein product, partial [Linum tenue]